jgi:hypothetical protein
MREAVMQTLAPWKEHLVKVAVYEDAVEVGIALPSALCEQFLASALPAFSNSDLTGARLVEFTLADSITDEARRELEETARTCTGAISIQVEGTRLVAQVPSGFVGHYVSDAALQERISWLHGKLSPWGASLADVGELQEVRQPQPVRRTIAELGEATDAQEDALVRKMADSAARYLKLGMSLYGDRDKAVEYAKKHSTAGKRPWELALRMVFGESVNECADHGQDLASYRRSISEFYQRDRARPTSRAAQRIKDSIKDDIVDGRRDWAKGGAARDPETIGIDREWVNPGRAQAPQFRIIMRGPGFEGLTHEVDNYGDRYVDTYAYEEGSTITVRSGVFTMPDDNPSGPGDESFWRAVKEMISKNRLKLRESLNEEEDGGYEVADHGLPPEVNTILTQFTSVKQHIWDTPQIQGVIKKAKKLVKDKHGADVAREFETKLDIARATACQESINEAAPVLAAAGRAVAKAAKNPTVRKAVKTFAKKAVATGVKKALGDKKKEEGTVGYPPRAGNKGAHRGPDEVLLNEVKDATVKTWIHLIVGALTRYDQMEAKREAKRGRVNIYRLGLLLQANEKVEGDMRDYLDRDDADALTALRQSMKRRFTFDRGRFGIRQLNTLDKKITAWLDKGKYPKYESVEGGDTYSRVMELRGIVKAAGTFKPADDGDDSDKPDMSET